MAIGVAGFSLGNLGSVCPEKDIVRCGKIIGRESVKVGVFINPIFFPVIRSCQCASDQGQIKSGFNIGNWIHGNFEAEVGRNPGALTMNMLDKLAVRLLLIYTLQLLYQGLFNTWRV